MKKTNKIHKRNRSNKKGGMHIASIMMKLRDALGGNTSIIYRELSKNGRMGKPKGMINLLIDKLSQETNDDIIMSKIKKLEDNIKEISIILGNKRTKDETKLSNIFKLMEGQLEIVITKKLERKCPSGRHVIGTCEDFDLCEAQGFRWAPNI